MNRFLLVAAASQLALCACAGGSAGAAPAPLLTGAFAPANQVEARTFLPPAAAPGLVAVKPMAIEDQLLPRPGSVAARERGTPASRVEAANRAAAREPSRERYIEATQIYPWSEGALYRLYTAPEQVSEIALQAGEGLISVAAGDTARWVIGDTTSGSGAARRTHILVKPIAVGLRTNLVITTDRRVYHVQLESTPRTAMARISWSYPQDELLALRGSDRAAMTAPSVAEGVAIEALNLGYRIEGDKPSWRPVRAFDDGRQVFIEFPASLAVGEAPPLFVLGTSGRPELVNYRVRGRYYVVDRLFAAAELRLGEKRQQVVRIVQTGSERSRRRGRAS